MPTPNVKVKNFPPHPMAFVPNKNSGNGISYGDRFITADGKHGRMDEAIPNGDAFVTMDDGTHAILQWSQLTKEKEV